MNALKRSQRREAIRLSGSFHVRLAEIGGNMVLARIVAELVARSSLIIGLYGASSASCSEPEHRLLLEAIADQNAERAAKSMLLHLDHIEQDLDLVNTCTASIDVRSVLSA